MAEAKETEKVQHYAAYDKTYLRFVGDPQTSKDAAAKEAKDRKVKSFEVREV